ncbi:uncharacterized protein N7482_005931 [Penicillium canariense]|uniref:Uncharacterized protein n=1 Tax=Penicillium canariense TaxID=189055 RepID=A0A9W9I5S7_9EURO|nr:uncharacterized protein N7482_005931 [Penicillium canariense]KAJ5167150.1 hypothetical protein N7482_005931 [Penicillium canariense]
MKIFFRPEYDTASLPSGMSVRKATSANPLLSLPSPSNSSDGDVTRMRPSTLDDQIKLDAPFVILSLLGLASRLPEFQNLAFPTAKVDALPSAEPHQSARPGARIVPKSREKLHRSPMESGHSCLVRSRGTGP